MKRTFLMLLLVLMGGAVICSAQEPQMQQPSDWPSLIANIKLDQALNFCGEPVALDLQEVRERLEKELLLTIWDRPQVVLWIKRSTRYLPIIEEMLAENNMPDDLKYMAIIESALRPHAGSRKGAIGYWQFLKSTGLKYGLRINADIDERRNIFASTQAAINYLKELYAMLGSWTLAAAAYNMGEIGLQSEMVSQKSEDYYQLYLPLETQRYVFRIIAAKLILTNPERFGFQFSDDDLYPPLAFDRIQIECFQDTPILIVAQAAKTYFKAIKDLNPEIRGHFLTAGTHSLLIPKGSADGFETRFKQMVQQWQAKNQERVYVVRTGDNLTSIAERFNVPLPALLIWNRLDGKKPIHPGDRLVIYPNETKTSLEDPNSRDQ
ncbi:MAG: transglycosylase SLT domain-containing protein [Desulfobacterales bacterium]|nr:transglycosylase SLT domain-containing protein [Desulfobacterales bacterium]